jgi:LacI family transcriptional regulator
MGIKLTDVAEKAEVSPSTVSLILNGKGKFSEEVREKVLKAAEDLGYLKNMFASAMATRRITHIGILVHEDESKAFEWHFIRQMIISIETIITAGGFFPIIVPISHNQDSSEILAKVVASGSGAIFSIHFCRRDLFRMLEDRSVPVVVVNNPALQGEFCTVCVDDYHGAFVGTNHLISLGHKRIGYVDYPRPDQLAVLADRCIGYRKALNAAGLDASAELCVSVNLDDQADIRTKVNGLMAKFDPTALFIHDDYLAAHVVCALQDIGLPALGQCGSGTVSIIAPGDTLDYNQPYIPRISTMSIDTAMMGTLAGELMLKRLSGALERTTVLKVSEQLIDRGSTSRPAD